MIEVCSHVELLHSILKRYGLPPDTLEVTSDIQKWCQSNAIPETNPFRQAKCFYDANKCHIVMRKQISEDMIKSAKNSMEITVFKKEVTSLTTDTLYLSHLLLHEIACFILQTSEQEARDRWAFDELSKHLV